jgi:hypothetical protein
MTSKISSWVGKSYTFEDGAATVTIIHVKLREAGYWVMYEINYNGGIPKRHVMNETEFIDRFGLYFGIISPGDKQ